MTMYRILFVCTANICRTPMAEYYLNSLIAKEDLQEMIAVESAGTWAVEGAPAAENSQRVCAERDLNLSRHRSRPIDLHLMKQTDLVLCMALEHKYDLIQIFPHLRDRIFTLKEYGNKNPQNSISIVDPYGGSIEQYRETCELIFREIQRIYPALKANAREKCLVS